MDLTSYLGDMNPEDFKRESDIRRYFSLGNLRAMFGMAADLSDRELAMQATLRRWAESKKNQKKSKKIISKR